MEGDGWGPHRVVKVTVKTRPARKPPVVEVLTTFGEMEEVWINGRYVAVQAQNNRCVPGVAELARRIRVALELP